MAFDTELSKCKPTVDTWLKSEKLANPAEPSHCESCHHHHSDLLKGIKEGEEGSGEKSHKQTGEAIFAGLVLTGLLETLQIEK